jgi:hypothetical protein
MLTKQESMNTVTSCHQVESTVLPYPVEKAWECLKSLDFPKLFPSHVKTVKFTNGSPAEVGSVFEVSYADGAVWTNRLLEVSEHRRVLTWELISASPEITFSSMLTTIRLLKVTSDNTTYLQWDTDYSNDVNSHIVQDGKFKKLECFKDLKNCCSSSCSSTKESCTTKDSCCSK